MKKIIFSAVTAVAISSVNVYATPINWDEVVKNLEQEIKTDFASDLAALKSSEGPLNEKYGQLHNPDGLNEQLKQRKGESKQATQAYDNQVENVGNPTDGGDGTGLHKAMKDAEKNLSNAKADLQAKEETLSNKITALIGGDDDQASNDTKSATNLTQLKKYYEDTGKGNDLTKAGQVGAVITALSNKEAIDLDQLKTDLGASDIKLTQTEYDSALSEYNTKKDEINKETTGLQAVYEAAKKNYETENGKLADLKTVKDEAEQKVSTLEGQISALKAEIDAAEDALKTKQNELESKLDANQKQKDLVYYSGIKEKAQLVAAGTSQKETALASAIQAKQENATKIASLTTDKEDLQTALTKASQDVANKESEITNQKETISQKQTELKGSTPTEKISDIANAKNFSDLEKLFESDNEKKEQIPTLDGKTQIDIEQLKSDLITDGKDFSNELKTAISAYNESIKDLNTLNDQLAGLKQTKTDAESNFNAKDVELTQEKNKTANLVAKVDAAQEELDTLKAQIEAAKLEIQAAEEKIKKAQASKVESEVADIIKNNKNMSETTKKLINANKAMQKSFLDAHTEFEKISQKPTKPILDGGLKELKANKKLSEADKKLVEKIEKQISQALNLAAKDFAESKKANLSKNALGSLNAQINNMNKRLGEIRGLNGEIGAWLRVYGTHTKNEDGNVSKTYSTQIGADKKIEFSSGDAIFGALFGYDKGKNDVSKSDTYSLGLYSSFIANDGYFADAVLKFAKTKHKNDLADAKNTNMFLASLEAGYRFNIDNDFYIEPSLELITGHVGKYEEISSEGINTIKSFTPIIFKPQAFFGASFDNFTFRSGLGAVINAHSKPTLESSIADFTNNGLAGESSLKIKTYDYGFVSLGFSYKISDNFMFNFGAEHTIGSKNKGYELNSTLRFTF